MNCSEGVGLREYPIIFSPPMVLAILDGPKRVTRRLDERWLKVKAGDRLWVREAWGLGGYRLIDPCLNYKADGKQIPINRHVNDPHLWYRAGDTRPITVVELLQPNLNRVGWRNAMFMPRWASRILLECEEDARMERLQDMTEEEAVLEGIIRQRPADLKGNSWHWGDPHKDRCPTPVVAFKELWNSLHTDPGERWEDNPEVVRVGRFRRLN